MNWTCLMLDNVRCVVRIVEELASLSWNERVQVEAKLDRLSCLWWRVLQLRPLTGCATTQLFSLYLPLARNICILHRTPSCKILCNTNSPYKSKHYFKINDIITNLVLHLVLWVYIFDLYSLSLVSIWVAIPSGNHRAKLGINDFRVLNLCLVWSPQSFQPSGTTTLDMEV